MKNTITILIAGSLMVLSCNKLDIENPNGGSSPIIETAEAALAYIYTGELARVSSMLTQQLKGNDIYYEPLYEKYLYPNQIMKNPYNVAFRHGISVAMDKVELYEGYQASSLTEEEANQWQLKADYAKILAASIYSIIMEYYHNPEKYNGRDNKPSELSYTYILELLNSVTSQEYIMYAELLKARIFLNQSKYDEGFDVIKDMEIENFTDFSIFVTGSTTNMNEWERFTETRANYLTIDSTNIINGYMINDPRVDVYFLSDNSFNFPMAMNGDIPILSRLELYFIAAELKLRNGDYTNARNDFLVGIQLSMFMSGATNHADYVDSVSTLSTDFDEALDQILTQKYLAMFGTPVFFSDYKRTKLPNIVEKDAEFPDKWTYVY